MPRNESIATTTNSPIFSSYFQLPTLTYCYDILGLGSRQQQVMLQPLFDSHGEMRSSRCSPSLHSDDCQEVAHDCMMWKTCYLAFQNDFKSLNDKTFDCGHIRGIKSYHRPIFQRITVRTQLVTVQVNHSVSTNLQYLANPICSSLYPNIDFFIRQNLVYCKEKIVTPESECRSFLKKCDEFLKCRLEKRVECMPKRLVAIPEFRPACQHWSISSVVLRKLNTGHIIENCFISTIPVKESNDTCDYQRRMCNSLDSCYQHRSCLLANYTSIESSDWFSEESNLFNDQAVFHCNQLYGQPKGLSLTYKVSTWSCDSSMRSYSLLCEEILEVCQLIAKCIEIKKKSPTELERISLNEKDCESPLEPFRSRSLCVKIPVIIPDDEKGKYLRDCSYGMEEENLKFFTDPQPYDTFCCQRRVVRNRMSVTDKVDVVESVNCNQQAKICNKIMTCYLNYQANLRSLLGNFNLQRLAPVLFSSCLLGIFTITLYFIPKSSLSKTYGFLSVKLFSEFFLSLAMLSFVSLDLIAKKKGAIPMQIRWIKDGVVKWMIYLLLSFQSVTTLVHCLYLALLIKYPLQIQEKKGQLKLALVWGNIAFVAYHVARLFLDVTVSSSVCSLFYSKGLTYSYELEFQKFQSQIQVSNSSASEIVSLDNFFVHFHQSCHAHYLRVKSSKAYLIYNVVLDGLFCQIIPMLLVLYSMKIFMGEMKKMIDKRAKMHFKGKKIRIWNKGTLMFVIQSLSMCFRHLSALCIAFYIWYHDKDNIFLTSTLEEQFVAYILISAVSIYGSNLLLTISVHVWKEQ